MIIQKDYVCISECFKNIQNEGTTAKVGEESKYKLKLPVKAKFVRVGVEGYIQQESSQVQYKMRMIVKIVKIYLGLSLVLLSKEKQTRGQYPQSSQFTDDRCQLDSHEERVSRC